jgi:outer membrane protein OmpA-like peptidoglycan-associated protein
MKRQFLIWFFGFSVLNLNAQDVPSNSIGASVLPAYNRIKYHKDDVRSKGDFNMGLDLNFRRQFHENWQFAIGVNYRKYYGTIDFKGLIDSVHFVEPSEGHKYYLFQVFNSIEQQSVTFLEPNIRLEYVLPLSSAVDFIAGIGLSFGINIAEKNEMTSGSYQRYAWFYEDHNLIEDLPMVNLGTYEDFLNPIEGKIFKHSLLGLGGAGFRFNLSRNWQLLTIFNFQHSLLNIHARRDVFTHHSSYSGIAASDIPKGVHAVSAGAEIGLIYRFGFPPPPPPPPVRQPRTPPVQQQPPPQQEVAPAETKTEQTTTPITPTPHAIPPSSTTRSTPETRAAHAQQQIQIAKQENQERPCYTIAEMRLMIRRGENIVGKKICAIKQINFEFNQSRIQRSDMAYLNEIVDLMKQNERLKIKINGHTDNIGSPAFNRVLSRYRAEAVYNYLIRTGGISADRLSYDFFGLTRPIADNDTEEGRATNRRVEFEIVEQ